MSVNLSPIPAPAAVPGEPLMESVSNEIPITSQVAAIRATLDADDEADGHLRVDGVTADLRSNSARSGALMIVSHAAQLVIGVTGTAILARLLQPRDFGYLAMVATLTNFIATFRDLGLTTAIVHRQEVSHEQASGLFWVNSLMSVGVTAIVVGMAPVLAWFYGEPRLVAITLVISVGILATSLSMLHVGFLRRQMQFGAITALEIGAMLAGVVVGIGSALAGAGYWALVFQQLAIYLWQSGAAWMLCRWRPARRGAAAVMRDAGLRSMVRYGKNVTGSRIITHVGRNLDSVLVGHFAGPATLGLYQKAYHWSMLPFWQIYIPMLQVAVSSLSRLQDDHDRYRLYVRTMLAGLFALTLPATALLFVEAEAFIVLLLGQQWIEAIPIFRVLCIGGYFLSFTLVSKWLYLSEGRTAEQLRWALISAPTTVLAVAVGMRWGAMGVATGFTTASVLLVAPGVWHVLRRSPLRATDFIRAVWRPALASIAAAALQWLIRPSLPHLFVQVAVSAGLYGILYFMFWMVLPGGRAEAARFINYLRHIRRQDPVS